jgi:hypothetical protein
MLEEAYEEEGDGSAAVRAMEGPYSTPMERARFFALRQAVLEEWQPRGGLERSLIDEYASAIFTMRFGSGAGVEQAHQALDTAIRLWSGTPWSALHTIWAEFNGAVHISGTSMDPAVVVYGWAVVFYGIPYLLLFLSRATLRLTAKTRLPMILHRVVAAVSRVALTVFDFYLLVFVVSWVAMFFTSLIWAATTPP